MPDDGKTPLERQEEAEKANTRVTDTGERIDGEPVSDEPVPVGTGASFDPPVGTHEVPDDKGGPDGQEPTTDLILRKATMDKQKEAEDAAAAAKGEEKSEQIKDETTSKPATKAAASKSTK